MAKLAILRAQHESRAEILVRDTLNDGVLCGIRGSSVGPFLQLELGHPKTFIFRLRSGPDSFSNQCSYMYSERLLWVAVFEFRISFWGDIVLGLL